MKNMIGNIENTLELDRFREERGLMSGRESRAFGKSLREICPCDSQGDWKVHHNRDSSIDLIHAQEKNRIPELIPIRHERMAVSPFTFYRGTAVVMADDLAKIPTTGILVQACGDAHISNFGMFLSPERNLVFDINDFDETLPGSWEWDLKRLLVSVEICGRDRSFSKEQRKAAVLAGARAYREAMLDFSNMSSMDVWYSQVQIEAHFQRFKDKLDKEDADAISKSIAKAYAKNHEKAVAKFTQSRHGKLQFVNDPPLIIPLRNLDLPSINIGDTERTLRNFLVQYRASLPKDRQLLLGQYRLLDIAAKVVGVGSVGTRCWIVLLEGRQENDYLILQLKEAGNSVLERVGNPALKSISEFALENGGNAVVKSNGQRIVEGQRAIQTVGDILLGWASFNDGDGEDKVEGRDKGRDKGVWHDYYVRQFWDGKGSFNMANITPGGLTGVAELCARVLAHAHAKTGDSHAIAGYLGEGEEYDKAMARFAVSYADQNEIDYELFRKHLLTF